MFNLSIGSESHYITFCPPLLSLDGVRNTPLFLFRGDGDEGQPNTVYHIKSLCHAIDTLGEPKSIGYQALFNMMKNNWCDFFVIRTSTSFIDALDIVIADGTYPHLDYLRAVDGKDVRDLLSHL